jgi:protocatechuate 3,4-dioxygenase beta subunit
MSLPVRALIVLALVFGCACSALSQQSSGKTESNSSVSGKVTIKGKPAVGIVVGMRAMQPTPSSPTYKAVTNEEGVYLITNIANGTYLVAPLAPAMITADANNRLIQQIAITDADSVPHIDFDLVRGGVITGKVTDADGHPMIELSVQLRFVGQQNGPYDRRDLNGRTDDRGIYRIFGVEPGQYKVVVSDNRRWSRNGPPVMARTYYPDVQDANKATVVDIAAEGEIGNIDVKIGPTLPGFSVSGRVVDDTGNPVPNFQISLTRIIVNEGNSTSSESTGAGAQSDRDGKFRLTDVRPGKYDVSVDGPDDSDLQAQAPVRFDVLESDVSDLVVTTTRTARISGFIVFEGTKRPGAEVRSQLSVIGQLKIANEPGYSWAGSAQVKPDGSFVLRGFKAGTLSFKVGGWDRNHGLTLTRIERDGNLSPNEIQINAAQSISGLRLFVTYTNGSIRGVVKTNGTLPSGGRILVQLARAEDPNFGFSGTEVDARGRFLIEGLSQGDYELSVFTFLPNAPQRPSVTKQAVSVIDGGVTDVTVTLDLTQGPQL